ncbi:MAG: hypothetical protein Fur0022_07070 [Anaerolineales bacterium]
MKSTVDDGVYCKIIVEGGVDELDCWFRFEQEIRKLVKKKIVVNLSAINFELQMSEEKPKSEFFVINKSMYKQPYYLQLQENHN